MADYLIKIELPDSADIRKMIDDEVLPRVAQAVRNIAEVAAEDWRKAVSNAKLWKGERDAYQSSIKVTFDLPFNATVRSDYKYADDIETGRPPYDLKRMLQTSKKIRFVKNGVHAGQRYLIIPMRHNVKDMPADVYSAAKQLLPSKVTGKQLQYNGGTGARIRMRMRATYSWGDRLPAGMVEKKKSYHHTDIYSGMVRFDASSKKSNRSTYLTFRLMGEWSTGWFLPAQPGQFIAQKVATDLQPFADQVIAGAFGEA